MTTRSGRKYKAPEEMTSEGSESGVVEVLRMLVEDRRKSEEELTEELRRREERMAEEREQRE